MKKSKLVIEYTYDFNLLGLISSMKGYKLAWLINQTLPVHLVRQPDLRILYKDEAEQGFAYFSFETPLNRLKLFKNQSFDTDRGKYFLVPEFPHFDFIILAAMETPYTSEFIMNKLRSIIEIQLASTIPVHSLKSKSNFIF